MLVAPPIVHTMAELCKDTIDTTNQPKLARYLLTVISARRGLAWVSYADESGAFAGAHRARDESLSVATTRLVAGHFVGSAYNVRSDGSLVPKFIDAPTDYDPRTRPFYLAARKAGQLTWPAPYVFVDDVGRPAVPGITCAAPVYDHTGKLKGVVTADFDLYGLSRLATQQKISDHSQLLIFTPDGIVLGHPTARLAASRPNSAATLLHMDQINDPIAATFYSQLHPDDLVASADEERYRQFEFQYAGHNWYAAAKSFSMDGGLVWVVGTMAPSSDFLAPVWRSQEFSAALALACVLAAILIAALLAGRLTASVRSLVVFMRRVGAGDLQIQANFGRITEFRLLSTSLNSMIADLREGLRMRSSLAMANAVQQRLLPHAPPKMPGLDVAGKSTYCDETGGDYFDYLTFPHRPSQLLLVVGDVMGHGVGSALLMAGCRGVLRSRADSTDDLSNLLAHLNDQLLLDSDGHHFMTMSLVLIDAKAQTVRWASAGHDPPIVYDPADNTFSDLPGGDIPLGIEAGRDYQQSSRPLRPGQVIVIGTDGIWEAANPAKQLFGKDRLRQAIRAAAQTPDATSTKVADAITQHIADFVGTKRPADDVTFVIVRLLPPP